MAGCDGIALSIPALVINDSFTIVHNSSLQNCSRTSYSHCFVHVISSFLSVRSVNVSCANSETWVHFNCTGLFITSLDDLVLSSSISYGDVSHIILAFDAVFGADDLISIADDG